MNTDVQTNEGHNITNDKTDEYNDLLCKMNITEENLQSFINDINKYLKLRNKISNFAVSESNFKQMQHQHYLNKQKIDEIKEEARILTEVKMFLATINGYLNNENFLQLRSDMKNAWLAYKEAKNDKNSQESDLNNSSRQSSTSLVSKVKGKIAKIKQNKLDKEIAERYQEYKRKNIRYSEELYKILTIVRGSSRNELITILSKIDDNISSFSQFANYIQDNIDNHNRYMFSKFNEAIAKQQKETGQQLSAFLNSINQFEETYKFQDSLRTCPSIVIGNFGLTTGEQKTYLEIVSSYPSIETIDLEILKSIVLEPEKLAIESNTLAHKIKIKGRNKSE